MSDIRDLPGDGFPDDDVLAAEFALGVLDGAERLKADRRRRQDPVFARAVDAWETRLGPMLSAIAPVPAPPGLWDAIDADLGRILRVQSVLAPRAEARAATGRRVSGLWQWFGLGSFGLATASLAALLVVSRPLPPAEPMAASLAGEGGTMYTAVVYPGSASATLVPISVSADPAHAHELWLIEPEKPPLSLGVLQQKGTLRIDIPPALLAKGGVLAITVEPPGGSPDGKPTGPVVAKGELQAI